MHHPLFPRILRSHLFGLLVLSVFLLNFFFFISYCLIEFFFFRVTTRLSTPPLKPGLFHCHRTPFKAID